MIWMFKQIGEFNYHESVWVTLMLDLHFGICCNPTKELHLVEVWRADSSTSFKYVWWICEFMMICKIDYMNVQTPLGKFNYHWMSVSKILSSQPIFSCSYGICNGDTKMRWNGLQRQWIIQNILVWHMEAVCQWGVFF